MGKSLVNEFSWSHARHSKFVECRRAYWFHYYGAWGGWEPKAKPLQRELYVLKRLATRFTWSGSIVHAAIRGTLNAIRAGRPIRPERVLERVHRVMRQDFVFSREKRHRRDLIRRDFNGLVEHEYDDAVAPEAWHAAWLRARDGLTWFFHSRWPALAQSLRKDDWLEVDNPSLDEATHVFRGVKVFAVPDFAYRDRDGSVRLIEWKSGASALERSHETQVVGSAHFVAARHRVDVRHIRATVVAINTPLEVDVPLDPAALARFEHLFDRSVAAMRATLVNENLKKNVPRSVAAFGPTANTAVCGHCPFRRPCQAWLTSGRSRGSEPATAPLQAP